MTILLDGGMGVELTARGFNADAKVAGHALIDSPSVVCDVHREFIAAGAEVITTWNYAVTPQRLALSGLRDRLGEITRIAVEMANEARGGKAGVRVAGSLPPLRASYEPNTQDPVSMAEDYAEIAGHLASGVDLFICETMSSAGEAAAAASAAAEHGKPVWVSWTLRDERDGLLRSGEDGGRGLGRLGRHAGRSRVVQLLRRGRYYRRDAAPAGQVEAAHRRLCQCPYAHRQGLEAGGSSPARSARSYARGLRALRGAMARPGGANSGWMLRHRPGPT